MSDSFAPPGETAYDLWVERSNLNGMLLSAVAYGSRSHSTDIDTLLTRLLGILFTVTLQTLLMFLQLPRSKIPRGLVTYISLMFILASIGVGTNAKFNQMTYIDDRNIPGGPNAFTVEFYATTVPLMSFAS